MSNRYLPLASSINYFTLKILFPRIPRSDENPFWREAPFCRYDRTSEYARGAEGGEGPDIAGCFLLPVIIKSVDEEQTKALEESSSLSPPPFTLERTELRRARRAPNGMTVVKRKLSSWGEQSGNRH